MFPQPAKSNQQYDVLLPISYGNSLTISQLTDEHTAEVLEFLEERPLDNVVINGFIRDHGFDNPLNRGTFYSCRDEKGALEGVALLGHAIFLYSRTDGALSSFAQLARERKGTHMIMGEQESVRAFMKYYSAGGQPVRRCCRELLFALEAPLRKFTPVANLRRADIDDLPLLLPVHAALACEESGVNPLQVDAVGFQKRYQSRIERGRVWIWAEQDRLIFKADVVSDTPKAAYLEGVYVDPNERRKGYGLRCVSQMSNNLMRTTKSISVLINDVRSDTQSFFQKTGFVPRGVQETVFLAKSE